jgi:serine protease Do
MNHWLETMKQKVGRKLAVPVLAVALVGTFGAYEFAGSARAAEPAPSPAPAAAPMDQNSVAPLLSLDRAMEALAAHVTPAVVNVTVTSKTKEQPDQGQVPEGLQQFFGPFGPFGQQGRPQSQIEHGLGSGVIISPDGYIVTNNHVVEGAVDVRVTMSDRRVFPAKVVGTDALTDLAVIKIQGSNFPSVPMGDSTQLHPGQMVMAFGNPYGLRFTVTRGIISALNRPNPSVTDRRKPGEFIQTDAAINPGNSGGPLVDALGQVIGINTFLISPSGSFSGMGFAIPTQIVKPTVDALIKNGKVSHGYMGIGITDVTPDNAKFFNMDKASGAVVSQVEPDTPGAKAGLKVGDVITGLDGKSVANAGELQVQVGQTQPGTTIHLQVNREGKTLNLPVTLEAMGNKGETESANASQGKPRWGIGLGDLSPDVRQQVQAPSGVQGAVVENVQPGSPADNAGLQRGDIIQSVNRKPVASAADAANALRDIPKGQDVMVRVWTNGGSTFLVLHPGETGQGNQS